MEQTTHDERMSRLVHVIERDPGSLVRVTPSSYKAQFVAMLGTWIEQQHGWIRHDGRALVEFSRYTTDAGQLIILYGSGAVLVQGKHTDDTHALLAPLVEPDVLA